jgi:hypothetical protein
MSKPTIDISKLEHKDMFGRDIKVGDFIVYAGLADRSAVLRAGQVIELTYDKSWKDWRGGSPEPKVRAKSWNFYKAERERDGKVPSGRQKDVTLGFLSRLVVVPESQVGDKVKQDLAGPVMDWKGDPVG